MRKSTFILIISLMSFALIGIIVVQISWIRNSIQIREKQFSREVFAALDNVSENIQNRELKHIYKKIKGVSKDLKLASEAEISKIIYEQIDTTNNEKFIYQRTLLEQKYKVPTDLFKEDSITFKRTYSKKDVFISKHYVNEKDIESYIPDEHYQQFSELTSLDRENIKDWLYSKIKRTPINMRVSTREINEKLRRQFINRGINTPFKFALYDRGMLTSVKSGYFKIKKGKSYPIPFFSDNEGNSDYTLYVNFPEKHTYILSSISKNLILSSVFILMIIGIFGTTLYQLRKQKQIAAIKTDFINNMTHEFKTPIATINLALDAIKNPQIINDKDKVLSYIKMIREENKRMHAQVETVLRISKLDKNQLDVSKEVLDIQEVLDDAISHIQLLIDDKGGALKLRLEAIQTEVLGNAFHLTNVLVNVLDNAIKYSNKTPNIEVFTENISNAILIHISDNGIGMSKSALKHIFDKFYREEVGNIHNIKGHGLGLSYVKKIIELHQGKVSVVSEKGKGSTFTIKLPVI